MCSHAGTSVSGSGAVQEVNGVTPGLTIKHKGQVTTEASPGRNSWKCKGNEHAYKVVLPWQGQLLVHVPVWSYWPTWNPGRSRPCH